MHIGIINMIRRGNHYPPGKPKKMNRKTIRTYKEGKQDGQLQKDIPLCTKNIKGYL